MNNSIVSTSFTSEGIVKGTLYILLITFVVFINIMIILSYNVREKSKRGIPEIFILNLAVSSLFTCVSVISVVAYIRMVNQNIRQEDFFCKVQCFFGTLLRLTDVGTTTGVAVDRFIAVYKPITYRTQVKLKHGYVLCSFLWLLCITIAALPFLGVGGVDRGLLSICTANWRSKFTLIVLSVAYTQFIVVLICYIGIFNCIKGFIGRKKAMIKSQTVGYSPKVIKVIRNCEHQIKHSPVYVVRNSALIDQIPNSIQVTSSSEETESESLQTIRNIKETKLFKEDKLLNKENVKIYVNKVSWFDRDKENLKNEPRGFPKIVNSEFDRDDHDLSLPLSVISKEDQKYNKGKKLKRFSAIIADRWNAVKIRKRSSNIKHIKESQRFAKVMGVIVLIFYFSWLPLAVRYFQCIFTLTHTCTRKCVHECKKKTAP